MMKRVLSLLLLVAICATGWAQLQKLTVNGTERTYLEYAPKNLGENRPLFIFCHGYNQDAGWMMNNEFKNEKVSIESVCDTAKFVMVFPNGIDRAWDVGGDRDINFIKAIIEKMVKQYKIDRNRVYLGGFSMGGMLTYNAINKMSDIIAAFVSCSGPSVVTPKAGLRPIPLLHIQGTADNFSGVQPALNPWIKHNGGSTTAKVITNYNGFSGATLHIWSSGKVSGEVRLIELKDKGHWICKETQVYTGKEMWNFCKRFSLNFTAPSVSFTSPYPGTSHLFFSPDNHVNIPSIQLTATASDPNGKVTQVDFYDGTELIATLTQAPYTFTVENPTAGEHTFKAIATDNDGETAEATVVVNYKVGRSHMFHNDFVESGSIPLGWTTYDGAERRNGFSNGYSSGSRVLQFTSSTRDFEYGLYFRNQNGKQRVGYAKYGLAASHSTLTLSPGVYMLRYRICNWNNPEATPIDICVERKNDGQAIASTTYTPNVNIGNDVSKSIKGTRIMTFEFVVEEEDDYLLSFYAADKEWGDGVIGYLMLAAKEYTSGIEHTSLSTKEKGTMFNLQGQRISVNSVFSVSSVLPKGVYIINGKKIWVK
jgi:predicted esterase